jgi:hypothetical protein
VKLPDRIDAFRTSIEPRTFDFSPNGAPGDAVREGLARKRD